MSKKFFLICIIGLLICVISGNALAQGTPEEQITITTYYPSPYGSYHELRAQRMAIGDTYLNNNVVCWDCPSGVSAIPPTADLVIEGNVGINTTVPLSKLHIGAQTSKDPSGIAGGWRPWMTQGLLVSWDTDNMFVGLKNEGADRKDSVIAWGDNVDDPLRFIFSGAYSTTLEVEVMRITGVGNVGIGTATPVGPLHVVGPNDAAGVVAFMPGADTAAAGTPSLNVGIGTTHPAARLDLKGGDLVVGATPTTPANWATDGQSGISLGGVYRTTWPMQYAYVCEDNYFTPRGNCFGYKFARYGETSAPPGVICLDDCSTLVPRYQNPAACPTGYSISESYCEGDCSDDDAAVTICASQ